MSDFNFNDAPWHDAQLCSVRINRQNPGNVDEVSLHVVWPDETSSIIRFQDCYRFECSMNFGVVALENILDASMTTASPTLSEIRRKWNAIGISLLDLKEYRIVTSSTGSTLIVHALSAIAAAPPPANG